MFRYRAYYTHKIRDAVDYYQKITGVPPTVIVARPEYKLIGETEIEVIPTRLAAWGMLLLSHELTPDEINHLKMTVMPPSTPSRPLSNVQVNFSKDGEHKSTPPKRHKRGSRECPHCHQEIDEFENLGWWWGWEQGREPPYWDELRQYVFRRDGFNCQVCHKQFPADELECHHIMPKEAGGVDGARNLTTLCHEHHLDNKPIPA